MEKKSAVILLVANLLLTAALAGAGVYAALHLLARPVPDPERSQRLAATLEANGLYDQALAAYENYRTAARLSPAEDANLHYHQAELATKLGDRKAALGHYLMAKEPNPKAEWAADVEKKIVSLLEGLGRSLDAQNRLSEATALVPGKSAPSGKVVAKLGDREITMTELDQAIQELPPEVQKQLADPKAKRQYLNQYLLEQMLYDSAVRKGLAEQAEVKQRLEMVRKSLLAQIVYAEAMQDRMKTSLNEVDKYLAEHKDKVKDRDQAMKQLQKEKESSASQALFEELRKLQDIKIYEDAFSK
jgi:tetratricopeptide (TPR) repeat protein